MKKYYSMVTAGSQASIYIFDDIVTPDEKAWREFFGETAPTSGFSLAQDISKLSTDEIHVHINSYGGVVSEGMAIYNSLKSHKAKIVTYNDGFCCSAAVLPWLAGDERITSSAAAFLFHQVLTSATGNADEFRELADELDTLTELTMSAYMAHANISEDEMRAIFKAGKYLKPSYVSEIGLATKVEDYKQSDKISASAKGAFFAQLFKPESNQPAKSTVEVKITDVPGFQQWADEIQRKIEQLVPPPAEPTPPTENNPMKFLNALLGGKD